MIELVRSPSQIEDAGLVPVDETVVGRASCAELTDIENDLRTGSTTFPIALQSGDHYMIEIVDAHEQLHIAHLTTIYTDAYRDLLAQFSTVSAATEPDLDAAVAPILAAFRARLEQALAQEDAHLAADAFRDAQLTAAQPVLAAIERRRALLACGGPAGCGLLLVQPTFVRAGFWNTSFEIHVTPKCRGGWSARSNTNWIEFRGLFFPSNSQSADAVFIVACNPERQPRTGTVTVAGQEIIVEQQAFGTSGVECRAP